MDLIEFLRARLDEDERAALGAKGDTPGIWETKSDPATWIVLYDASGKLTMGQERHIARHDPARVLREVEAHRRIVDEYEASVRRVGVCMSGSLRRVVMALATVYDDHADYCEEWRPAAPEAGGTLTIHDARPAEPRVVTRIVPVIDPRRPA